MAELSEMPAPVREVHVAMEANADSAGLGIDRPVYTRRIRKWNRETNNYDESEDWIVGAFADGFGDSMVWKGGTWFYRQEWDGEDVQMRGGHDEAMGCARCFFTG